MSDHWLEHGHEIDGSDLAPVFSSSRVLAEDAAAAPTPTWTSGWRAVVVGGGLALLATLGVVGVANAISDNLFPSMGATRPASVWQNPVPPDEPTPTTVVVPATATTAPPPAPTTIPSTSPTTSLTTDPTGSSATSTSTPSSRAAVAPSNSDSTATSPTTSALEQRDDDPRDDDTRDDDLADDSRGSGSSGSGSDDSSSSGSDDSDPDDD